jgi:hypothetical protein
MGNPSTIWGQLSMPNPPAGSIPFVGTDNASIITDVLNFFYDPVGLQLNVYGGIKSKFTDASGVPGNAVISTPCGRVTIPAGRNHLVVTGAPFTTGDIVLFNMESNDATLFNLYVSTSGLGYFQINGNANATQNVTFAYVIIRTW